MNKLLLLGLSLFLCMSMLQGQRIQLGEKIIGISPCKMPTDLDGEKISKPYTFKKSAGQRNLNFSINFLPAGSVQGTGGNARNCLEWPEAARDAFTFAMEIWSDVLENEQNIGISACWTNDLGAGTLGTAGPTNFYSLSGAPTVPDGTLYPAALAETLLRMPLEATDINANFNADRNDWYFGLDMMPGNNIDFVSVVLHEIGHGLGFLGGSALDDGIPGNGNECLGAAGTGCIGLQSISTTFDGEGNEISRDTTLLPTIYDQFIDLQDQTKLLDQVNPSVAIRNLLEGGDGSLEFDDGNHQIRNRNHGENIHTPMVYTPGSSYSHFSEATFPNELMSPSIAAGQVLHDVGMAREVMTEIGWVQALLPVDLLSFSVSSTKEGNLLTWATASETNNDYFIVQRSSKGKLFQNLGRIVGSGTSYETRSYHFLDRNPDDGSSYYRLKQVDYDGSYDFSKVVQVNRESDTEISFYPNPVRDVIKLIGLESHHERIAIYNLSGWLMYEGEAATVIDLSSLPPGTYQMVVMGSTISSLRLVKQ